MRKLSSEKGHSEPIAEVLLTPLCDVSLTLLIILMIISPLVMQSLIRVSTSKAVKSQQTAVKKEKPLFINITKKAIFLNTKKVKSDVDLAIKLRNELTFKRDKTVIVTADKDVRHGTVVHILDVSKQNGAKKLSLMKKKAS